MGQDSDFDVYTQIVSYNEFIVSVAAGFRHFLLLTADGKVFVIGGNDENELGLGRGAEWDYKKPVLIPYFNEQKINIQSVCCGQKHSLALSDQHVVSAR